jgi:hypothetical protein
MVADAIANFDSFAWVAIGLFVAGLFGVIVYERSNAKATRREQQQSRTSAADTGK